MLPQPGVLAVYAKSPGWVSDGDPSTFLKSMAALLAIALGVALRRGVPDGLPDVAL